MRVLQGFPEPLGVTVQGDCTNFALTVEREKTCELLLYRPGERQAFFRTELMPSITCGELRFLALNDKEPWKYEYEYLVDGSPIEDPYAKVLCGGEDGGPRRSSYPKPFDWKDDHSPRLQEQELVAYSLHIRGFTKHVSSQVKARGTFRGVIEKIPYLLDLGVNQIHCMPIYEFDTQTKRGVNYWGYGEAAFFAPKRSYAESGDGASELKEMVLACHQAGIEVLLDFPFTANTSFQMINSCLRYYVREYHVDGFILNPWNVSIELLRQDPFLKGSRLYRKEDEFQNTIRRFLRGEEGMTSLAAAQLARSSAGTDRFNYVTGHTGFTLRDLFSYDSKHNEANGEGNQDGPENNYSWNCGAEGDTSEEAVLELRKKLICCAFAFLLTAQGVPVLLAGDEFGNSQKGNNNVYCQDNELSWLDWTCLDKEKRLYTYVKELIAFRKQHKILHQRDQLTGMDRRGCGLPDFSCHGDTVWREPDRVSGRLLGILYGEAESGGEVCYIIYNMHWLRHMVGIPNPGGGRKWFLAADSERGVLRRDKPLKNQREIEVEPRTVHILIGRKP